VAPPQTDDLTAVGSRGLAAVVAVADALLRPVLRVFAGWVGATAALVLGVIVQIVLIEVGLLVVPGVTMSGLGTIVATLVMVALLSAVTRWLIGVNDSSYLVADLVRRGNQLTRWPGAPADGINGEHTPPRRPALRKRVYAVRASDNHPPRVRDTHRVQRMMCSAAAQSTRRARRRHSPASGYHNLLT
jgi:hypothetical protein